MKKLLIPLILITLATVAGVRYKLKSEEARSSIEEVETEVEVPKIVSKNPPILLVHGFNQSSDFWSSIGLVGALEKRGTMMLGNYQPMADNQLSPKLYEKNELTEGQSALYTLSLPSNGTVDIRESASLLAETIEQITECHACSRLRIIGFSAGGIVSREYLTKNLEGHKVVSLTTVSTPHLGSEHAWLAVSYHKLKSILSKVEADTSGNFLDKNRKKATAYTLNKLVATLSKWSNQAGIDINSKCAYMLAEPEDGNYLDVLANATYPTDIKYHCVITEENIKNYSWQKLKNDFRVIREGDFTTTALADSLLDLARNGLGKLDDLKLDFKTIRFRGDGVVSKFSQNLNNIPSFKNNSELRSSIEVIEADHGNPEIKSAILDYLEFYEQ